jgi:hypothetical protein
MFNKNLKLNIFLGITFLILFLPHIGLADLSLTLKNSPPCLLTDKFGECFDPTSIEGYINLVYRFMLGVGGFLAVGMIVWGAILISLSGGIDKVKEGKDYITSSLFGLALLFGSYLILKTVNPNLVYLTPPTAPPVTLQQQQTPYHKVHTADDDYFKKYCPNGQNGEPSSEAKTKESQAKSDFQDAGIKISSDGNCDNLCDASCTSVGELPPMVLKFLTDLKKYCNCDITLTGGNEVGHQSHAPGEPVFDLRATVPLIKYLTTSTSPNIKDIIGRIGFLDTTSKTDQDYSFCKNVSQIASSANNRSFSCSINEIETHIHFRITH